MTDHWEYELKKGNYRDPYEMHKLVELQNAVYGEKHVFTNDTFKFWYLDNPNGEVISFNAWMGDVMAAHYAVIPVRMEIQGRVTKGTLSMATVTHPDHRGRGLFKMLAKETYDEVKRMGYEFVIGVANDNSYPGFIKYFPFQDVGPLDVLIGHKSKIVPDGVKQFRTYWDKESIAWRTNKPKYSRYGECVYGTIGAWKFKKAPFVKTFMGKVPRELLTESFLKNKNPWPRPITLYVGLGSNAKSLGYRPAPSFLHKSKFHLIFMDLTEGKLPMMTKDNVFIQLMDFDVA